MYLYYLKTIETNNLTNLLVRTQIKITQWLEVKKPISEGFSIFDCYK